MKIIRLNILDIIENIKIKNNMKDYYINILFNLLLFLLCYVFFYIFILILL